MEIMDRLCEQNDMERTTFMQFAIMGMLDYMSELGMMRGKGGLLIGGGRRGWLGFWLR